MAIQHSGDLSVYRRDGKLWTKSVGAQLQLAGQLAWHPSGTTFALSHQTKTTALNLIDANTGEVAGSVPGGGFLGYVGEQGRTEGLPSVSGWIDNAPIVNSGNRALVRLGTPERGADDDRRAHQRIPGRLGRGQFGSPRIRGRPSLGRPSTGTGR